jgi:hypothetical protein
MVEKTSVTYDWPRAGPRTSERFARHRAAKLGYRLHRSRRRKDGKGYMLIHKASSTVLLGADYTATLASILEFLEREYSDAP